MTTRKPASSASGEFESETVSGPMAPATKRWRPSALRDAIGPLAALPRRLLVDLPGQVAEERVLDDLLVERRVLAAAVLARIVDEELALGDAGGAEGVGLDDVRAGLEEAPVDVADHLRLRQREEVAVVQQILLRVLEALAADVRLRHAVGADGRPHRAVDDGDALLEQLLRAGGCGAWRWWWLSSVVVRSRAERSGLVGDGEHHLQVRLLGLAAGTSADDDVEAGAREQAAQRARREARVTLAVARGDLVLLVLVEAQQRPAARPGGARARTRRGRAAGCSAYVSV